MRLAYLFTSRLLLLLAFAVGLGSVQAENMRFGQVGSAHYRCISWRASDGLPSSTVQAIAQGPDGCLWLGTSRGLVRFDSHAFLPPPASMAALLNVTALFWDSRGQLWVAHNVEEKAKLGLWRPGGATGLVEIPLLAPTEEADNAGTGRWIGSEDESQRAVIRDIYEDKEHRLWLATSRGVRRVDFINGSYQRSPVVEGAEAAFAVRQMKDGRVSAALRSGLGVWGQESFIASPLMPRTPVASIAVGGKGELWLLPRESSRPLELVLGEKRQAWPWPWPGQVGDGRQVLLTQQGDVWAVNDEQGAMYLPAASRDKPLQFTRQNVLPSDRLLCVAEDSTGSIWLGTADAGLCQLRMVAARTFSSATHEAMPDSQVTGLAVDRDGAVWTSFAPTGVVRITSSGSVARVSSLDGLQVTALAPRQQGGVWGAVQQGKDFEVRPFATAGVSASEAPATALPRAQGTVRRLAEDNLGHLWAVAAGSGTWRLEPSSANWQPALVSASGRVISALHRHRDGTVWLAVSKGFAPRIKKEANKLTDVRRLQIVGDEQGLHGPCETLDGAIWACRGGAQLWTQLGSTGATRLTPQQGLPNDLLVQTQADLRGNLWLQTLPETLYFVPLKELRPAMAREVPSVAFRPLTRSDGVQAAPSGITHAASAVDGEGHVWFTADRSLVMVTPDIATRPLQAPLPWVEKVTVDGVDYPSCDMPSGKSLALAVGTRSFTVHFGGIGLAEPSRVRCRYRLRGVDADWITSGAKREVTYLCPPPAQYVFEVLATNEGEAWPLVPSVLTLEVRPALYQRSWFISIVTFAVLGLIVGSWHYLRLSRDMRSLANEQRLYDERSRIARDLHDHLGASISSLRISVAATRQHLLQPTELTAHLAGIEAQMQASALQVDETIWLTNPNNDTLDAFCSYAAEYSQEFCEQTNTECIADLPNDPPERTLPGNVRHHLLSILKEALSNSVQHGKATKIDVCLRITEVDQLVMVITDNGKPKDPDAPKSILGGNGLKNMRARAEELGGTFEIGPHESQGMRVSVVVPLG